MPFLCAKLILVSADFPPPRDLTPYLVRSSDQYSAGRGFGDVYRCWYHRDSVPKEVWTSFVIRIASYILLQVAVKAFRFKRTLSGDPDHGFVEVVILNMTNKYF